LDPENSFDDTASSGRARRADSAEQLREQAAAWRRLAGQARTRRGTIALDALGDHFDEQARQIDPSSQRR
jgi:hypothetical protein